MLELLLKADPIVKATLLILLLASITSWAIIIQKTILLFSVSSKIQKFEKDFEELSLDELYKKAKDDQTDLLSSIFVSCVKEWNLTKKDSSHTASANLKERLSASSEATISTKVLELERGLGLLANIGSISPFVGLLGTVFGIVNSFSAIAQAKSASLATVAPGIAEALFATGFALFVAIPAVFSYNAFISKTNNISEKSKNFFSRLLVLFLAKHN